VRFFTILFFHNDHIHNVGDAFDENPSAC